MSYFLPTKSKISSQTKDRPFFEQVATFLGVTMQEKLAVFSRLEADWKKQQTLQSTFPLSSQGADVPEGYGNSNSLQSRVTAFFRWMTNLFNIP